MLLKGCQLSPVEKKSRVNVIRQQRNSTGVMATVGRGQRKVSRVGNKRLAPGKRIVGPAVTQQVDPYDSSNDSGLGAEQEPPRLVEQDDGPMGKRRRTDVKLEASDDANDNFTFAEALSRAKRDPMQGQLVRLCVQRGPRQAQLLARPPKPTRPQLQILAQPEQQHRARYQTEGSRGAVKDRTGNSFPSVKLVGFEGVATLQVFIGSDGGRVEPHMFYQACRVSGKNSTPCTERLMDGTVVIEVQFQPDKDMTVTCDCVGILKERNVDVEHRFPLHASGRVNKKKSTRCRMIFRCALALPDGTTEQLEISSQPIICTQPPGVPEMCKKSLTTACCSGGQELFVLGKNFLKDSRVVFSQQEHPAWEVSVVPDKEYLQQSHLVCIVPAYRDLDITAPVTVRVSVTSSGKSSETHAFVYTPRLEVGKSDETLVIVQPGVKQILAESPSVVGPLVSPPIGPPVMTSSIVRPISSQYLLVQTKQGGGKDAVFLWKPSPTPEDKKPNAVELGRAMHDRGLTMSTKDLKGVDLCMKPCVTPVLPAPAVYTAMATGADLSSTQSPSMATLRRFVSAENTGSPLPSLSVEKFLSGLEHKEKVMLPKPSENTSNISFHSQPDWPKPSTDLPSINISNNSVLFQPQPSENTSDGHSPRETLSYSQPDWPKPSTDLSINISNNSVLFQPQPTENTSDGPRETLSYHSQPDVNSICVANNSVVFQTAPCESVTENLSFQSELSNSVLYRTQPNEIATCKVPSDLPFHPHVLQESALTSSLLASDNPLFDITSQAVVSREATAFDAGLLTQDHVMLHCQPATTTTITTSNCSTQSRLEELVNNVAETHLNAFNVKQCDSLLASDGMCRMQLEPALCSTNQCLSSVGEMGGYGGEVKSGIVGEMGGYGGEVKSGIVGEMGGYGGEVKSGVDPTSAVLASSIAVKNMILHSAAASFSAFAAEPVGAMSTLSQEKPVPLHAMDIPVMLQSPSVQEKPLTTKMESEVVSANQKREEGMVPRELTQMSEHDLLSYINPSCFDTV